LVGGPRLGTVVHSVDELRPGPSRDSFLEGSSILLLQAIN
jgi:hypothetical protein